MSRQEKLIVGSIPLHTLEADVDYGFAPSMTTYGVIGVKVYIYRGIFGESKSELDAAPQGAMTRARRRREAGPGQRGGDRPAGPGPRRKAPEGRPAAGPAEAPPAPPAAPAEPPAAG